ncbi:MAG: hypothetical protein RL071_3342, partial [Pseudomonadota bacterium]
MAGLVALCAAALVALHLGRAPEGGAWAAAAAAACVVAILLAGRAARAGWRGRPIDPAALAAAWDGAGAQAPQHGLASAALCLSAGAGVGAPDLIALAVEQAQAALAARPPRPAALRLPIIAFALTVVGLLLSPRAALRLPSSPSGPGATPAAPGGRTGDRPVLLDVVDAIAG